MVASDTQDFSALIETLIEHFAAQKWRQIFVPESLLYEAVEPERSICPEEAKGLDLHTFCLALAWWCGRHRQADRRRMQVLFGCGE